jgi:diguanylate cyclase (GGDEF)-like protein
LVFAAFVVAFTWVGATVDDERRDAAALAATRARLDAIAAAQGHVGSEVNLLLMLGAFDAPPAGFEAVAEYMTDVTMDDATMLASLRTVEANGAEILDRLRASGAEVDAAVEHVLAPLPDADLDAALSGSTPLDGAPYGTTWAWAQRASAAARTDGDAALDRLRVLGDRSSWKSDPVFVGALLVVAAALFAAAVALRLSIGTALRRLGSDRDRLQRRADQLGGLFDAARAIGGTLDRAEAAGILAEQASATIGTDLAVVATLEGDQLVPIATAGAVAGATPVPLRGLAGQVADTARAARAVVTAEPLLGRATATSAAAAPLVHAGRVQGVVMVGRSGDALLGDDDEVALELLALCAAPVLAAADRHADAAELALVDALTGLHNRRAFDRDLAQAAADATRENLPLSVALVDVDHFKRYNDTYGHQAGDDVLRRVAAIVRSCLRGPDRVYRIGGEELAVLLPGAQAPDALTVAERVRAAVAADAQPDAERHPVTVSAGVATVIPGPDAVDTVDTVALVAAADAALYEAKGSGRNRVCTA